jgi:hypothetical protein
MQRNKNLVLTTVLFLIVSIVAEPAFAAVDPTVEEILKKHAAAIGTDTARTRAGNRIAIGKSQFEVTLPSWRSTGKAVFASDDRNLMLMSSFDLPEYPFEKVGLFRGKVEIPFTTPGSRSPMGSYLLLNDNILTERLFGGAIRVGWRMLDPANILERLRFGGTKKVNGRVAYVIRYNAKGNTSADSAIELFFDAKNFRHLRTEYRQKMPEKYFYRMGIFGNQEGENLNRLVEEFSEFREAGNGLTLPHRYSVNLVIDGRSGTKDFRWTFAFDEYRFGQNFGEKFFSFEMK